MTLTTGTQLLRDTATGRGTLVTADGAVWELNATAAAAVQALSEGGTAATAEQVLCHRWPDIPRAQIHADLAACLQMLHRAGAVSAP